MLEFQKSKQLFEPKKQAAILSLDEQDKAAAAPSGEFSKLGMDVEFASSSPVVASQASQDVEYASLSLVSPYRVLELFAEEFSFFNEEYELLLEVFDAIRQELAVYADIITRISEAQKIAYMDQVYAHINQMMGFAASVAEREETVITVQKHIAKAMGYEVDYSQVNYDKTQKDFKQAIADALNMPVEDLRLDMLDASDGAKLKGVTAIANIVPKINEIALNDKNISESIATLRAEAQQAAASAKVALPELMKIADSEYANASIYPALIIPDANENIYSMGDGKFYYADHEIAGVKHTMSLSELASMGVHKIYDYYFPRAMGTDGAVYLDYAAAVPNNKNITQASLQQIAKTFWEGSYKQMADLYGGSTTLYLRGEDGALDLSKMVRTDSYYDENGYLVVAVGGGVKEKIRIDANAKNYFVSVATEGDAIEFQKHMLDDVLTLHFDDTGYLGEPLQSELTLSKPSYGLGMEVSMRGYSFETEGFLRQTVYELLKSDGAASIGGSIAELDGVHARPTADKVLVTSGGLRLPEHGENVYSYGNKFAVYSMREIPNAKELSLSELKAAGATMLAVRQGMDQYAFIDLLNNVVYEDGLADNAGPLYSTMLGKTMQQLDDEMGNPFDDVLLGLADFNSENN